MLSASPAGFGTVKPAALAPEAMKPRPEEVSRSNPGRDAGGRADAPRPARWEPETFRPAPAAKGGATPPAAWEPDPIKPAPAGLADPGPDGLAASGDDEEAPVLRPGAAEAVPAPGKGAWEPETFRPRAADVLAQDPARVKPGAEADAVVAGPNPAEAAAVKQAAEGYAELGSYAAIRWNMSLTA
jgi:hypothetical protein